MTQALWQQLGQESVLCDEQWPAVDASALVQDEVEVVVQVNGKLRGRITVGTDEAKDSVEAKALACENVQKIHRGQNHPQGHCGAQTFGQCGGLMRTLFTLTAILLLSACGYHLKQAVELDAAYDKTYLNHALSSDLYQPLAIALSNQGVTLVKDAQQATAKINIVSDRLSKQVQSIGVNNPGSRIPTGL